jgi:hypothetical protein
MADPLFQADDAPGLLDGFGIYDDDGGYRIVLYSQQGEGVLWLPREAARALGAALLQLAGNDPEAQDV